MSIDWNEIVIFKGKVMNIGNRNKYFEKVYEAVMQIPKGKVTTYGALGKALGMSPRIVGQALHNNPYGPEVPCHRVVNRDGRVAPGYAFGGKGEQKRRLEEEEVEFKDELHVDLNRSILTF